MPFSSRLDIRNLTAASAAAALAVVLGYAKLYRLPQGGSITLETIPILVVSLWRGVRTGALSGALTGLLKLLLDPYVVHPVQVLLDYPLPFALLAISAFVPRFPRAGILLGNGARWGSHVISGIVFFGSYAPEGMSVWRYSAVYNISYVGPEAAIGLLLVPALLRRVAFHRQQ